MHHGGIGVCDGAGSGLAWHGMASHGMVRFETACLASPSVHTTRSRAPLLFTSLQRASLLHTYAVALVSLASLGWAAEHNRKGVSDGVVIQVRRRDSLRRACPALLGRRASCWASWAGKKKEGQGVIGCWAARARGGIDIVLMSDDGRAGKIGTCSRGAPLSYSRR